MSDSLEDLLDGGQAFPVLYKSELSVGQGVFLLSRKQNKTKQNPLDTLAAVCIILYNEFHTVQ